MQLLQSVVGERQRHKLFSYYTLSLGRDRDISFASVALRQWGEAETQALKLFNCVNGERQRQIRFATIELRQGVETENRLATVALHQ